MLLGHSKLWSLTLSFKVKKEVCIISAYTAKQIAIRKEPHLLIKTGKYDGFFLRKLRDYTLSDFD